MARVTGFVGNAATHLLSGGDAGGQHSQGLIAGGSDATATAASAEYGGAVGVAASVALTTPDTKHTRSLAFCKQSQPTWVTLHKIREIKLVL